MNGRRWMGSLRARMALTLSTLLLVAVAPFLLLIWRYFDTSVFVLVSGFVVLLLVAQYLLISYFTDFVDALATWARALASGTEPLLAPLPDAYTPQLRELNHLCLEGAYTVRHQTQQLAETHELFEYSEQRLQKW